MRHRLLRFTGIAAIALLSGCYHTAVYTGFPGAGEKVSQPWARSFVFGLIAPPPVELATKCRAGVYKIETSHTLSNLLALLVTAGIYSPMKIDVTCVLIPRISQTAAPFDEGPARRAY